MTAQDEVELPRQVGGVAQPRAQPLPGKGGHLVGGVAGQQDPAIAPALDQAGGERVERVALERGRLGAEAPRLEQAPRRLLGGERLDGLIGKPHELEAPPARSARHGRRRPGRIADLHVERAPGARVAGQHVDDQPVEEVTPVLHRRTE